MKLPTRHVCVKLQLSYSTVTVYIIYPVSPGTNDWSIRGQLTSQLRWTVCNCTSRSAFSYYALYSTSELTLMIWPSVFCHRSYSLSILLFLFTICRYVYKRLRFLNNRNISQLCSLVFLAVWHGLSTGYFMCFFLEFLIINGEKLVSHTYIHAYI